MPETPQPPVSTQASVKPEPAKKSSKWLIVTIILFLLVTSSWLFYQNQKLQKQISQLQTQPFPSPTVTPVPSTNPTADWKTYTNEDLGFSFEYPVDAKFEEENGKPKYYIVTKSTPNEFQQPVIAYSFRVGKTSDTSKNSLYEYASSAYSPEKKGCSEEESYTPLIKTELAGKKAYKYQQLNCYGTNSIIYYVLNGQDILYISTGWSIKYGNQYQDILDQILSTFRFLDEPSKCLQVEDPCNPQGCSYDQSKCNN